MFQRWNGSHPEWAACIEIGQQLSLILNPRSAPIKTFILTFIFALMPKRQTERPPMAILVLKHACAAGQEIARAYEAPRLAAARTIFSRHAQIASTTRLVSAGSRTRIDSTPACLAG
jgi:hypothetical protein